MRKKRKPWLAGLLSFAVPGLGHIYAGQAKNGVLFIGVFLLGAFSWFLLLLLPGRLLFLFILAGGFLLVLSFYIYQIINAVTVARKQGDQYELRKYNRWYVYLAIWFVFSFVLQPLTGSFTKTFIIRAYKIPSGAMIPTLLVGDHILVNKFAYGITWPSNCEWEISDLPLECYSSNLVLEFQKPQWGDVIVFPYPEDEKKTFIKRIIGLPGDTLEIKEKVVFLNGEPLDDWDYTQRIDPGMIDGSVNPRDNFGPVTVPQDSYFVMGDNRDQSLDSRFWGYVNREKIRGKAFRIYWSWRGKNTLEEWIRWDRIGQGIQ